MKKQKIIKGAKTESIPREIVYKLNLFFKTPLISAFISMALCEKLEQALKEGLLEIDILSPRHPTTVAPCLDFYLS